MQKKAEEEGENSVVAQENAIFAKGVGVHIYSHLLAFKITTTIFCYISIGRLLEAGFNSFYIA